MIPSRPPVKKYWPRQSAFWLAGLSLVALLAFLGVRYYLLPSLDPTRLPPGQWRAFTHLYLAPEGRIFDTGNDNISHSEGQGYAMLFAAAYDDREKFDLIWTWTKTHLQVRDDALFAWKWTPSPDGKGGIMDSNNASDGDLLIAWALYRAFLQWRDPAYALAATQILDDLRQATMVPSAIGLVLLPAAEGFVHGSRLTLNPSYFVFPALQDLSNLIFRREMKKLLASGEALCARGGFGEFNLPPDWLWLEGKKFALPENSELPAVFGYNAVRIPLQIAWLNPQSKLLSPFVAYWQTSSSPENPLPATLLLPEDTPGPDPALPGMLAVRDFVLACHAGETFLPRQVAPITPDEAYFSAALKLLTTLAARDVIERGKMQLTTTPDI
jgi:endoglucanase